jgi:hypothetical protein
MHLSKTAKFSIIEIGVPPLATAKTHVSMVSATPKAASKAVPNATVSSKPEIAKPSQTLSAPESHTSEDLDAVSAAATRKKSEIKQLKKDGAAQELIEAAASELKKLNVIIDNAASKKTAASTFNREGSNASYRLIIVA